MALSGLTPGTPTGDLEPLAEVLAGVRVAGLGESTHGTREFFLLKHRLLEFLVGRLGFTTLAMEASASAARVLNDYVSHGTGQAAAALAGLGFWTWHTAEMLAVVEWLREHNRTAPEPGKVRFAGIDPQHAAGSLREVRAFLQEAAPGRAAELTGPLAPLDGFRLGLDRPVAGGLDAARRLEDFLAGDEPAGRYAAERVDQARWHARILRQSADLAGRPYQHHDPERTISAARDAYLADNVDLLLRDPEAKVAVWAHNGHVAKSRAAIPPQAGQRAGVIPMGQHLARRHGAAYYALGLLFGQGEFRARRKRFGRISIRRPPARHRVPAATTPAAIETHLAAARAGDHVVDLRGGPRSEAVREWLGSRHHMRSYGAVAGAFTYKLAFMTTVLAEEYDGLAFVARGTCSTPL
ncbi:erythromycin esterase family protein [Nonomuraea zeae]|uniref:Erythromycin esterase family protein n=1 Tax=Nonomuraea zeae TaxID=1642303 RepID=A0A5S4GAC9_9ACTN|nr:erythromycin esterase family protein [Nonomuraea zeae]